MGDTKYKTAGELTTFKNVYNCLVWLPLPGEWNEMKWDRLWREMSFLEIAESDTGGKEAFFSVLEHKTD